MTSLREQLGGGRQGVPELRMILPPGWVLYDTSEQTERDLLEQARVRLRDAGRPETYALLSEHVKRALAAARKQGAFMMIMAGDEAPEWATVPVSILGTLVKGAPGISLDAMVADAVERRGARALHDSRQFLRWVDERKVELSGETAGAYTVVYLTPIPGSRRAQALQLTATLVHPVDTDPTADPAMASWLELLDAHVATLTWTGR
ncbi:hypothetical protein [Microbacterium yannicii]|uniref:hypothetical protein n=1 Tax=Microbacterium yannicii TaxID=671622 RepID=UPI0012F9BE0A|nr:hypothetical protein [Microbacterium yannicii]